MGKGEVKSDEEEQKWAFYVFIIDSEIENIYSYDRV